jgi:hypothetical protein
MMVNWFITRIKMFNLDDPLSPAAAAYRSPRGALFFLNLFLSLGFLAMIALDPRVSGLGELAAALVIFAQLIVHGFYVRRQTMRDRERRVEYDQAAMDAYEAQRQEAKRQRPNDGSPRYAARVVKEHSRLEMQDADDFVLGDDGELYDDDLSQARGRR